MNMNMKTKSSNSILGWSYLMMLMKNNLPYICMVVCNIVYAGMALFAKAVISKGMNPYIFGAYRQAFGTLALAPFAFYLERKNSALLSCSILCKIFLVSLIGITLCINLLNVSFCYVPATFASATTNTIPAITFIIAILLRTLIINLIVISKGIIFISTTKKLTTNLVVGIFFRMESVAITEWSGVAKMVSFGNLITDFQEEEDNVMIDDNVGFTVVFDEEEEQNGFDDDDLKVETKLLGHLQFDNFSLVKCLLQNRLKIVWCTRLARAEDQKTREKIEEEMLESGLELAAILEQLQAD
ncbi:hypothetical protein TEA_012300 [Camellia sinensis var. sinensis]|uniref:WAT1-related protein n=1 Tax=Camellia sinensis var. sinensis TaxID=542762 RepID=A0A4S4D4K6_CAMSN|nr:hypothetical protein TEA_012300 [Camellia sinensis var. sinensis]